MQFYNLDAIIAVGYRVNSRQAAYRGLLQRCHGQAVAELRRLPQK